MTVVTGDDPNYRAQVMNSVRKIEQDMLDVSTLSEKIGLRAAWKAVYGVDNPSLDEDSEEFKEEIQLLEERYGVSKNQEMNKDV